MIIDDLMIKLRFFIPSEKLTKRVIVLNSSPDQGSQASSGKRVSIMQRAIGERLYRYLASAARNNSDQDEVKIWDCIPWGMSSMLGFPSYGDIDLSTEEGRNIEGLLRDLTEEFRDWLCNQPDGYRAPWGEMILIREDYLKITANLPIPLPASETDPVARGRQRQEQYALAEAEA